MSPLSSESATATTEMTDTINDVHVIQQKLSGKQGAEYWRSLDELAETPEFKQLLRKEYPGFASILNLPMDRRQFIKILGASLALAGLTACANSPIEKIVPYVQQSGEAIPGEPLYFASAMSLGGYAQGVLVENHLGRPIKIEGNPNHPASLGATDAYTQASLLSLYDPDRSQVVTLNGQIRTFDTFLREARTAVDIQRSSQGAGLRILSETTTSPTLADQLRRVLTDFPLARWHQYEPLARDNVRAGSLLAFNAPVETTYRFDRADVILSLDSDFVASEPGSLRFARDFAQRRRVDAAPAQMNRLYVVESSPSITGAKADHRLPLRPTAIESFARAVAKGLGVEGIAAPATLPGVPPSWIPALVRDLQQHRGTSLIIAGETQPPFVHALAHAMNTVLGNPGNTVLYLDPVEANPVDQLDSLRDLVTDLGSGKVELLLILGANPVYTAPVDLEFRDNLQRAKLRIHCGLYQDETATLCQWHIPQAHYLESWSDVRAFDGTVSIIQPLIAPLYGGKSIHEVLAIFGENPNARSYDIVQAYWRGRFPAGDFDSVWRQALNDGVMVSTTSPVRAPSLASDWVARAAPPTNSGSDGSLEISYRRDPTVYDGRFANNAWLQELPKPLTRLTWDNVVLVSPATAQRLGLSYELAGHGGEHGSARTDVVELAYQGRKLRAPVWIIPGQPDDTVTVFLGYGRTRAGSVGTGVGYDAYSLRTGRAPWFDSGVEMRKTGDKYELAAVQQHNLIEGRGLVRSTTIQEFSKNPNFARDEENLPSMYPEFKYEGYAWGMAVDLQVCIGCNACVVACQAENNIPVVGKDQVLKAREMHWLRIDTYHKGSPQNPETYFEPVPCMHCENAPCEPVCPVAATVHSSEGLNEMVYNRCVGTRYCSNNCPYKVRRFNFLQFADWKTASLKPMRNPDVTVRSRGVMEKCTYCVQRINRARINAEKEGRSIRDGEVVTACQAACPADAIVFGDINDKNSRVARVKAGVRDYALLAELNTRPRTTYEAAIRNPNPELESG